jgi:DNA-binding Xre family transcriptional regulator
MHNAPVGAITMNGRVEEFLISRARKIERALVRKNWTRVHLAEVTGYDERTIRNVLGAKPVRDQTIIDICQALEIESDLEDSSQYVEVAGAEYGEYPRGPYRRYEGGYFAYRRSFTSPARLMRTCVEMEWAEDEGLIFREHSRFQAGRRQVDNSQSGRVHISQLTGLLHLVTCFEGSVRLITLTKMIGGDELMRGAVLTQIDRDAHYLPAVSPLVLRKLRDYDPRSIEPWSVRLTRAPRSMSSSARNWLILNDE